MSEQRMTYEEATEALVLVVKQLNEYIYSVEKRVATLECALQNQKASQDTVIFKGESGRYTDAEKYDCE